MRTYLSDGFNFFSELKSEFFIPPHPSNFFLGLKCNPTPVHPHTCSSSGISRPKKRDPKNVADPPVPPCKSEMQKKMRSKAASQAWKTCHMKETTTTLAPQGI